jgi:hypothetical protein
MNKLRDKIELIKQKKLEIEKDFVWRRNTLF